MLSKYKENWYTKAYDILAYPIYQNQNQTLEILE
jgi:hypothetical protein